MCIFSVGRLKLTSPYSLLPRKELGTFGVFEYWELASGSESEFFPINHGKIAVVSRICSPTRL